MKKNNLYVDIHVLQTVPPSCVNRDDTGSPKTAVYGGVTRARVSSQSWKHAMRLMFRELFDERQVGDRTKKIPEVLSTLIKEKNPDVKNPDKLALETLKLAGVGVKEKDNVTDALFFISQGQTEALANLAVAGEKDKKVYKEALKDSPSVDIALFGRMVASDPSLNFDAASQVAHSISTHAVHNEYDYFTAVDDCAPEDNAGAGHLGTVEFNSATLYRYATVNVKELQQNLKEETVDAVCGFAEAFICSMPDGKQNTFANRTLPDMVYIAIRKDQPINFCGAFEKPVKAGLSGYVDASEKAFIEYTEKMYTTFADRPENAIAVGSVQDLHTIADVMTLNQALEVLKSKIQSCMDAGRE